MVVIKYILSDIFNNFKTFFVPLVFLERYEKTKKNEKLIFEKGEIQTYNLLFKNNFY